MNQQCRCTICLVSRNECPALVSSGTKATRFEIERRDIVCRENFMNESLIDESDYHAE